MAMCPYLYIRRASKPKKIFPRPYGHMAMCPLLEMFFQKKTFFCLMHSPKTPLAKKQKSKKKRLPLYITYGHMAICPLPEPLFSQDPLLLLDASLKNSPYKKAKKQKKAASRLHTILIHEKVKKNFEL